jgi:hypothetical protein
MKKYTPPTIKLHGEVCHLASKKAMKALYDKNLHHGVFAMYNEEYYVKPSKLSHAAIVLLKAHGVKLS